MASALALKRLISSNLLSKSGLLRTGVTAPSISRSFNTNAMRDRDYDDDAHDRELQVDRRSDRSVSRRGGRDDFLPDLFDPFSPSRSLSQVLNLMDQMMENPFLSASRGVGAGFRRGWDAKETEDALHLRVDMPGLDKGDIRVSVEQNTLTIKGEGKKEEGSEDIDAPRYTGRIDLPEKLYKIDQIKAEMKNGVLKVTVPKMKEEERNDVFHVKVD